MSSYDIISITQLSSDGGASNGDSIVVVFVIGSQPGLSNDDEITFGMSSESFSGDNFQLSDSQTLTIGDLDETSPEQTKFSLASSGTKFQANSAGSGQFQGYTGGSYSSGDFTITTGGGGGGGGDGGGFTIRSAGKFTIKSNSKLTVR
jgi:hypothetical protein